jgi:AhpD family alkylhydroperoxidase
MARIEGVSKSQAGLVVKLTYRFGPRMMTKLTGRAPQTGSGLEPMEIWAHQPKMMMGMGRFNQAIRKGKSVEERIKNLIELKGAQMIGCEFCVDLGSQICRKSGFTDEELLALVRYQSSDLFTDREKTALDYAVAVMRTPVEVTDELFARMRSYFDERQLVEITALLTLVNLDRFNAAFKIGAAGFSEGMVCVPPDRPELTSATDLPVRVEQGGRQLRILDVGVVTQAGERDDRVPRLASCSSVFIDRRMAGRQQSEFIISAADHPIGNTRSDSIGGTAWASVIRGGGGPDWLKVLR